MRKNERFNEGKALGTDTKFRITDIFRKLITADLQSGRYQDCRLVSGRRCTGSSRCDQHTERSDHRIFTGIIQRICDYYRTEIWCEEHRRYEKVLCNVACDRDWNIHFIYDSRTAIFETDLTFLKCAKASGSSGKGYIAIIIAGLLATFLYDACAATLRAIGDAVTPLIILAISVALNIVGDLFFVVVLKTGVKGAAIATVLAQIIAFVICWIYMIRKYEILRLQKEDFKDPSPIMVKEMISAGMSMGFMSSLVNIGTLTLQTAINKLGKDIIIAHTAARKISEIFMIMFSVFGQTMATYCGQNMGAGKIDRVKRGIWLAIVYTAIWSGLTIIASYTIGVWLVYLVTGSYNKTVILNATNYLKFDTLFYIVTTLICILRNAMQGLGDHITPLISSGLEMAGKIVIAATLVPWLGYTGVIICEPIVWFIMVIPLLIQTFRMPVLRTEKTDGKI